MSSISELEQRLGFRVAKTGPESYQVQRLDSDGRVHSVAPSTVYTYQLWLMCQELTAGVEGRGTGQSAPQPS